jgi:recombination protein RecA
MAEKSLIDKVTKLSKSYKSLDDGEFTKSGSIVIDSLLGGGIPKGVFILWSAEPGCGKSTGALHISKTYCSLGKKVLYLDYEGGVNTSQINGMGLAKFLFNAETNPEGTFYLYQVQTYKDAEAFLDELLSEIDLLVIDSATAMLTEKVKGSSSEDVLPGVDSRVMSTFLKKYKAESVRNGVSWIIVNQMRTKISFMGNTGDIEAGGNAIKFYTDIRLVMKKSFKGDLEREEDTAAGKQKVPFGAMCTIKAVKNRYERPNIPLQLAIIFGRGMSNEYAYYDYLEQRKAIKQSGAWYTIKFGNHDEKLQGQLAVIDWLREHRDDVKEFVRSNGGYKLLLNSTPQQPENYEDDSYDTEDVTGNEVQEAFENDAPPFGDDEGEYEE